MNRPADTHLDRTLMALADPTRRTILKQLAQGEARITDLARPFVLSFNAISKHIRVLEHAGLVRRRRNGREHVLSFEAAPLDEALDWIETQRAFWTNRLNALDALLTAKDKHRAPRAQRTTQRKTPKK